MLTDSGIGKALHMRYLFITTTLFFLLAGCGKKGPLVPPNALTSSPVNDLKIMQKGENFQISWSIHERGEEEEASRGLAGFRLLRREVLPPDQDCEVCPNAYQVVKEVDLNYLRDTRRLGDRLVTSDTGVITGRTYQYKVEPLLKDGTSGQESNKSRLLKSEPIPGPTLKAVPTPTSILLHWDYIPLPANVKARGINIYRWRGDEPSAIMPLNNTPLLTSDYEDLRLERGVTYHYCVRSVTEADGILFESASSNQMSGAMTEPD
jgi:predicted small lipoprotein YifL